MFIIKCSYACICRLLFVCFTYNLLVCEYVAAAVQFYLQNIKDTCRRNRQLSQEDYLVRNSMESTSRP